jgi:hypothetical protein
MAIQGNQIIIPDNLTVIPGNLIVIPGADPGSILQ